LYDRDCGFCRWTTGWILRWDRHGRILPLAIQSSDGQALLGGVAEDLRLSSWHIATPAGDGLTVKVDSAGAGFGPLLRALPGGRGLAVLTERFPDSTERAYRWVAGNRSRFGRRLSNRAKRRTDALIAARTPQER